MPKDLTYVEAIEQVMLKNGFMAPLKLIYKDIWKYKDASKITGKPHLIAFVAKCKGIKDLHELDLACML